MEDDFLEQTRRRSIDLFICSDAEAILGIGDQGVGVSDHESWRDVTGTIESPVGYRCTQPLKMLPEVFPISDKP